MSPHNHKSEFHSPETESSFANIAKTAITYMLQNSQPESLTHKVRSRLLNQTGLVVNSLSALGKVRLKEPNKLGISSNEVIAKQEGLLGFTPHNQSFELNRMNFSTSLSDSGLNIPHGTFKEKERLLRKSPEKSRYLSIEPVTLKVIDTLVKKYKGFPDRTLKFTEENGRHTVAISGERALTLDDAVRLVIPTTDGKSMEFINLTYDQFINISGLIPTVSDISHSSLYLPLISDILHNGLSKDKEAYLKRHGITLARHSLDEWYAQSAAIVTVSNNDFFIYDQRGAIQVNLWFEIDPESNQYEISKIDTQAVHLAATAVPITNWLINDILPLGTLVKDKVTPSVGETTSLDKVLPLPVVPSRLVSNKTLPEHSPLLANMQSALILSKYGDEGAKRLAEITNMHEVIVKKNLPAGLVEIVKDNKELLTLLEELDPNILGHIPELAFTTYFMLAAAMLDKRSSMLSVNPDKNDYLPNALEMALLCNGVNLTTEDLVDSVFKIFSQANFSAIKLNPSGIISDESTSLFYDFLSYNHAYTEELMRANLGRGTPGTLARLTGSLRDTLENISRQLASPAMAQLEPNTQVSSLGNMTKKFKGKVKSWGFKSSTSRSIVESDAINGGILTIGQKVFANPIITILSLDEHCDPKLFDGMIRTFKDINNLDVYDKILVDWMIGRRKQELHILDSESERDSYIQIFQKLYKDIIVARLEKSKSKLKTEFTLAKKLQTLRSHPPYTIDYKNLPPNDHDELKSLFQRIADADKLPLNTVSDAWLERIESLPNGVHDLYTSKDPIWTSYLASVRNIDIINPDNQLAPSLREQISDQAKALSRDVSTSQISYNKSLVFSDLSTFYKEAGNDAELLDAMKEISNRFSYALTKYLSGNPNNTEQIENLRRAINLNAWKKGHDILNTTLSIALSVNTHLVNLIVNKLFESHLSPQENNTPLVRTRSPESENQLLNLLITQVPNFEILKLDSPKQLCELAKSHNISKEALINYLTLNNKNYSALADYLTVSLNPSVASTIKDEISKSLKSLTIANTS